MDGSNAASSTTEDVDSKNEVLDLDRLSPAERRVLDLALDGRSVRAIAESLVLTESTIHSHLTSIYRKLGIRGRLDLLARTAGGRPAIALPRSTATSEVLAPVVLAPAVLATVIGGVAVTVGFVVPASLVAIIPACLLVGLWLRRATRSTNLRRAGIPFLLAGAVLIGAAVLLFLVLLSW